MIVTRKEPIDWGVSGLANVMTLTFTDDSGAARTLNKTIVEDTGAAGQYIATITNWDTTWSGTFKWTDGQTGVGHIVDYRVDAMEEGGGAQPLLIDPNTISTQTTAASGDQSTFVLQSFLPSTVPAGLGPGWYARYFGQIQTVLSYDPVTLTGTVDAPFATPLESGHPIDFFQGSPASLGGADGYYVKRTKVVRTAGQANFDRDFNLDETALVADEDIAQQVFDEIDRYVDGRANVWGIAVDSDATGGHVIGPGNKFFNRISDLASKDARVEGYFLRGTLNDDTNKAEGQMSALRKEARDELEEIFQAMLSAAGAAAGNGGIEVIMPACNPCWPGAFVPSNVGPGWGGWY